MMPIEKRKLSFALNSFFGAKQSRKKIEGNE